MPGFPGFFLPGPYTAGRILRSFRKRKYCGFSDQPRGVIEIAISTKKEIHMQKKLIALAVAAAAAAPAFAQSNVTVYGIADMYFARAAADGVKATSVVNSGGLSGSRLGFKGTEDIGGGTKALFVLEYGLGMDTNTGLLDGSGNQARQQLLGVTGAFGTAVAGYAQTAGYDFACGASSVAGSALDPYHKVSARGLLSCGIDGRAGNALAYISPSFGGVTFAYNHARVTESRILDSTTGVGSENAYANLVGVNFAAGPVTVGGVYSKITAKDTLGYDVKEAGINGSYDLGVVKLYASYQNYDKTNVDKKNSKFGIGAAIPVGAAGAVHLAYADSKLKETADDAGGKGYTVAYTHGLSKRTTAYAGYNAVKNKTTATSLASVLAPDTGKKNSSVIAIGLRHSF